MPHAVILNTASKANTTGGTFADVLAANSGDSLAIPNFVNGGARILKMWGMDSAAVAEIALTMSRVDSVHDAQFGIRFNIASLFPGGAGKPAAQTMIQPPFRLPVFSGDALAFTVTSTANDDLIVSWLTEYDDLPGTAGQFASWDQVQSFRETTIGLRVAPVASGTEGAYGTARALNADDTRLTGAKYYAILGWTVQTPVTTVSLKSSTWGNSRLGLPSGSLDLRSDMGFVDLSKDLGKPLIPIINGYDAANVLLEVADDIASTSPKVDVLMYQLSRNPIG